MADGVNIDWGLLKQPDYVGDYQNAFTAGRQAVAPPPTVNAFTLRTPTAAPPAAAPPEPDPLEAPIGALDAAGRTRAAGQADLLQNLGAGLRAYPYVARPGILAHLAPALMARGFPAQALAVFDPTDAALDAAVAQARALGARLGSGA